jgi:Rnl2 family RNA ligase
MKFKKYSSIENSYRDLEIQKIQQMGLVDNDWVVMEKIHGANFSFWYDGETLRCAKRSGFISLDENFYDYQVVLEKYGEKVKQFYNFLTRNYMDFDTLTIFGEIFGGGYDHPEVERKNIKQIQKGVQYTPDVEFVAFDVMIDNNFLDFEIYNHALRMVGMPIAPVVFVGEFDKCLNYPNDFQTLIPRRFGLPEIAGNVCEGVVIKPTINFYHHNGSRIILKNKNDKFKEKQKSKKEKKVFEGFSTDGEILKNELMEYICENRLRNVISKVGSISQKEFCKLLGLFAKDVWEDFVKENDVSTIIESEEKMLKKLMNKECASVIRPQFQNIIDNTF